MIEANFTPFPIITTERLVLRGIEITDDADIFAHRNNDRVNEYLKDFRHGSIEETQAFISRIQHEVAINKTILWVLTEKGNNKFMGTICLWNFSPKEDKAETGYTMSPEFYGKGYMQEAMEKVIEFGFNTLQLKTIEAYTHRNNNSSIQLLLRNKFKQDRDRNADDETRIIFTLTHDVGL